VRLQRAAPVHGLDPARYDADGRALFAEDIYGLDQQLLQALRTD
jgi:murein L,D-transpeptidase YcbB/YkuD